MLIFSAITPHTPLLIPSIGKENLKSLEKTQKALERLTDELFLARPETIIVFSSHSGQHHDAFSVNLHDEYTIDFKEFGNLSINQELSPDLELIAQIQRRMRKELIPFTLDSFASLDFGTGVPLYYLSRDLDAKIIPATYSGLDNREHLRFGSALKEVIDASNKRIAVVASGDLSHCLTTQAPLGFHPEGEQYDHAVLEAVKNLSTSALLNLESKIISASGQCLYEQILILFGVLEKKNVRPEILSYEAPFGVGYLVAQFHLNDL
jgi:aromatic ring-opening dioxygenase LigB subunit